MKASHSRRPRPLARDGANVGTATNQLDVTTVPAGAVRGEAPRTVRGEGFVVQGRNGERREVAVPCPAPECSGLHLHRIVGVVALPVLRRCPATGLRYLVTVGLWTRAGVPSDARSEVA